ncbi:MAG: trimethylamine methyltransferase family protein [Rhizobiaceae bacterium]
MVANVERPARRGGRARHKIEALAEISLRSHSYRQLRHPFQPQRVFSDDGIANIHNMALRVLRELGIKILHDEARTIFEMAGALVDHDSQMVRIGDELVAEALRIAPRSIRMRAAAQHREQLIEPGAMIFYPGSGCPNVSDLERGRRPGSLESYNETIKLHQSFDVIHMFGPSAEPQDVAAEFRHYEMMRGQLVNGDKPMFVYARGKQQVEESFDLIRLALDLSDEDFVDGVWALTVINTNSPRQLDVPMAQGVIDFARARQLSIITPFCLAGAMAPVSIAGALVLQHAEALAAITLAQLAQPGAPVLYGGFASNVDMKSGSPAFGTPEHIKFSIVSGQLARHIDLPWRGAAGAASNTADMQAATENNMGLWAALQANTTVSVHSAGWLEGGLCFGYEKFINDVEALQTLAELCMTTPEDEDSLGWSALQDVQPGGHFFATEHTMARYKDAFYEPLVADLSNFGAWSEAGAKTSTDRATDIWRQILQEFKAPDHAEEAGERIAGYIVDHMAKGGAAPAGG